MLVVKHLMQFDDALKHMGKPAFGLQLMLNTMAFNLAKILRHEHARMQAWAVKDAADMLQQYSKLSSGTELLDLLMHNIEEADRMKIVESKVLAMVIFCAQLDGAAKLFVARFMTEYVGRDARNVGLNS